MAINCVLGLLRVTGMHVRRERVLHTSFEKGSLFSYFFFVMMAEGAGPLLLYVAKCGLPLES